MGFDFPKRKKNLSIAGQKGKMGEKNSRKGKGDWEIKGNRKEKEADKREKGEKKIGERRGKNGTPFRRGFFYTTSLSRQIGGIKTIYWENLFLLGLIGIAYLFVYLLHLWTYHLLEPLKFYHWHGELMITNPDGYHFGAWVQKLLYGMHPFNPRMEGTPPGLTFITIGVMKITGWSLDRTMLFMPPIFGSLIVIPIILIGKLYNRLGWGFFSALLAGIGWSYYNRTLLGYYDTDMFSVLGVLIVLYFWLKGLKERDKNSFFWGGIVSTLYFFIYPSGRVVLYGMGSITLLYLLIQNLDRRNWWKVWKIKNREMWESIIYLSIGLSNLPFLLVLFLLGGVRLGVTLLKVPEQLLQKGLKWTGMGAFLLFLITTNFLMEIVQRTLFFITSTQMEEGLHFLNVNRTIREASQISFYVTANRIVGSLIGLLLAIGGYLWLLFNRREFLITLPLWGIGLLAPLAGLRFTIYAVPIAALGGVYLFIQIAQRVSKVRVVQWAVTIAGVTLLIIPNLTHIVGCCSQNIRLIQKMKQIYPFPTPHYIMYPLFTNREIASFDRLKKMGSPKDYVISWWDYGYFIHYYSNKISLIDGGKHTVDNFLVSAILMSSNPYLTANLSRLAVETYHKYATAPIHHTAVEHLLYSDWSSTLFAEKGKPIQVSRFLEKVGDEYYKPPTPTRNIYLLFPIRIVSILYPIGEFSDRDLNSGESFHKSRIYGVGKSLFITPSQILIPPNILIDTKKEAVISLKTKTSIPIKRFIVVMGKRVNKLDLNPEGLTVMLIGTLRIGIVMDDYFYKSMAIQMGVLGNYNRELFELVEDTPFVKIYKLKR